MNGPVTELADEITREEAVVAIGSVKSKSPGEDGIPTEVYRAFNDKLITLLTKLFNRVLRNGEYPKPLLIFGMVCATELVNGLKRCLRNNFDFTKIEKYLIVLNSVIEDSKRRKCSLFVCYVDFRKAFDCVQHELLWLRLSQLGRCLFVMHYLNDFLTIGPQNLLSAKRTLE